MKPKYPCSNDVILDRLRKCAPKGKLTWVIASDIRDLNHGYDVDTKWVRVRLTRLEREGKVTRYRSCIYGNQLLWKIA